MGLFSNFTETVFLKEESELQKQYNALIRLSNYYPNNEELKHALYMAKKGIEGENEIAYQLKKANIGMYVLRDINLEYQDMKAQIDYIVVTPLYRYLIECKNLIGNITVNEKGDFIREYTINGKKIKKGMYSPLRQVEAQREVMRKISEQDSKFNLLDSLYSILGDKSDYYTWRKVLVVAANPETILNTSKAPSNIKYKVLRADGLIRQIQYDLNTEESKNYGYLSQKQMLKIANSYLEENKKLSIDYYEYYKNKFKLDEVIIKQPVQSPPTSYPVNEEVLKPPTAKEQGPINKEILRSPEEIELKNALLDFRKNTSKEMEIPPYYVFNNEELDLILDNIPKTKEELKRIIPAIKVKCHGDKIIEIINSIHK